MLISAGVMWRKGSLIHSSYNCQLAQPPWKTVKDILEKLRIELPCTPAVSFLGIYHEFQNTISKRCFLPLCSLPFSSQQPSFNNR